MELPDRIRVWRQAAGISPSELARRLGVSQSAVAQWEAGTTTPLTKHLLGIARECGVSMQTFWGRLPGSEDAASG